jgi:hypothetical protein
MKPNTLRLAAIAAAAFITRNAIVLMVLAVVALVAWLGSGLPR